MPIQPDQQAEAARAELHGHPSALDQHVIVATTDSTEILTDACDCSLCWADSTIVPLQDSEGRATQYVAIHSDITQHKVSEQQQLMDERARLEAFVEHVPVAIAMFDREMRCIAASRRFLSDHQLEGHQVIGRHHSEVWTNLPDPWQEVNRRALAGDPCAREEGMWYPEAGGASRYLSWEARPWRTADGQIGGIMIFTEDISLLKRAEDELARAARLDRLTGLPNRGLFLERLQHAMTRAQRAPDHHYAVMFLDLDRFKIINDSLGHSVGDALLVGVARRLRAQVGDTDSVSVDLSGHTSARLGGDEFVVLLDGLHTPDEAVAVAERLLDALAQPYLLGTHEVYSTVSIGIVMGDLSYRCAEDVVRDADTAMYESKRLGRCRYTLFDASMRERVQRRLRLESELRKAIGAPQLWLAYQPIVSLSTGAFVSVEALLRWSHPTDGPIDPSEFVAIAEESDLIMTLGEWALREACRQLVCWQQELGALAPRKVSINVSRRQFALPDLPHMVEQAIRQSGILPSQIQLELTEDSFVPDTHAAMQMMRAIKSLGVELAIDDFGTGTSSFASLHEFPVDVLKIHRSMLLGIEDSHNVASLIYGLAVTVRNMGIDMVAEGVETPAQVIALQELGCDLAQGFYFAKPLTPDEVQDFATRTLSLTCSTRGATAYANQWNERLAVFHAIDPAGEAP